MTEGWAAQASAAALRSTGCMWMAPDPATVLGFSGPAQSTTPSELKLGSWKMDNQKGKSRRWEQLPYREKLVWRLVDPGRPNVSLPVWRQKRKKKRGLRAKTFTGRSAFLLCSGFQLIEQHPPTLGRASALLGPWIQMLISPKTTLIDTSG